MTQEDVDRIENQKWMTEQRKKDEAAKVAAEPTEEVPQNGDPLVEEVVASPTPEEAPKEEAVAEAPVQ